jgi:hypothetical protein
MNTKAKSLALHKSWNPSIQELEDGGPEVQVHFGYIVNSKPAQEGSKELGVAS